MCVQVVGPGDAVLVLPEDGDVRVGNGIQVQGDCLVSQRCGVVRQTKGGLLWVEGRQKRYIPSTEDVVVGVIVDRIGEVGYCRQTCHLSA